MPKANLMLHCGAYNVGFDELKAIETPRPTGTWFPMSHTNVFTTVTDTLIDQGYRISQVVHAVSKQGKNYFGLAQVDADFLDTDEYGLVVGYRNSHSQDFAAGIVAGSQVFICDNLAFSGEINFKHRHTLRLEEKLPEMVNEGVSLLSNMYMNQEKKYNIYKQHEFFKHEAESLVIDLYREGFINASEIGKIVNIYDDPSYDEYGEGTAWTLFNATTEAMKMKINRIPKTTIGLHKLLDKECNNTYPHAA